MSRVVVVDDHADDLELYVHVLRHGGHEAVPFTSPVEALQAIAAEPPDLVLADLLMPELDGFELVHALRSAPATCDQRVVLASAVYTQGEFAQMEDDFEHCSFLAKPATPEQLLTAVDRALETHPAVPAAPPADFELRHRRALNRKLLAEARRLRGAENELRRRADQDAALAALGRRALDGLSEDELLDAACSVAREQTGADLVEVLVLEGAGRRLRMVAGAGWSDGVVGHALADARPGSVGARTIAEAEVCDLVRGIDDPLPDRLAAHGVVVGIRAAIPGPTGPVGLIGAYMRRAHAFAPAERSFLHGLAHLLGSAHVSCAARAEAAHREAELQSIFVGARDGLAIVDRELRCVRVNPALAALLGRRERELLGMSAWELVAPQSLGDLEEGWAAALRDGSGAGLVWVVRSDGVDRAVEYSATMEILDGFHLVSFRDVTERVDGDRRLKATMNAVEASERRYANLIETLPNGMVTVDPDGRIALVNPQTERMFGYGRSELIDQPIELIVPKPPTARGGETVGRRRDASEFPVEIGRGALESDGGTLVTYVITDVTERRALERQLNESQKLDAIGRLAGGIAHDFNNVLQVIVGYALSAQRRTAGRPEADEVGEIVLAAERAASLTRQLLAFSRRQVIQPVVLDLNAVVQDTQRMLARMVGDDVEMSLALDPSLRYVLADAAQLEQVLANLLVNARDAMPSGGRVTITTENVLMNGDAASLDLTPGPYVRLCIEDTGIGMDEETVAHAFEPFFTTKGDGDGSGLGLSTVHGIVAQSGGGIRIESAPGAGTRVCIHLPAVEGDLRPARETSGTTRVRGGAERILLAEDDPVIRRLLKRELERLGYAVTTAADATEALAAGAGARFDLLVTDFML
ncbi:MAG: PAS domain S-box protein, partial [Acidobacteriota bacterium]|nr:PAS domain S-box protein [Acidobacteriota bacterium]